MNPTLKDQILELKAQNKTYHEIQTQLGCAKSTISYHLGEGQKQKTLERSYKYKLNNKASTKISAFHGLTSKARHRMYTKINRFHTEAGDNVAGTYLTRTFSVEDLSSKFGNICYLTGRKVDMDDSKTYELDHIIPKYLGGESTFENCGLACRNANRAKADMPLEEFFKLCVEVVKHNNLSLN